jgi:hypothetical protein
VGLTVPVGTGPTNAQCSASYQPTPSCAVTGTHIQVAFPSRINPVASLNYTIGPNNGPQNGNPISPFGLTVANTITPPRAPFLNTSVAFLQAFDYLYDAANGFLGLKALTISPYSASTPSVALGSVFQCFFNSAGPIFGGSPFATLIGQPTGYSSPYTYRYNPAKNNYVAISSSIPAGISYAAVNDVYILPNLQAQPTYSQDQGSLASWLQALGCQ